MTAPANLPSDVYAHPRCVQLGVLPYLTASTIRERVNANNGWAVGLFTCPACHQAHAHVVPDRPAVELQAPAVELEQSRGTSRPLSPEDNAAGAARTLIKRAKAKGLDVVALTGPRWVGVRVAPTPSTGWVSLWHSDDVGEKWDAAGTWRLDGVHRHRSSSDERDKAIKALTK